LEYGCTTEIEEIKSLLLKHPREGFGDQLSIDRQWKDLNYLDRPIHEGVCAEYELFLSLLREHIPQINFLPFHPKTGLDSIYIRDPLIITEQGAILGNMGKTQRKDEPKAIAETLEKLNIPVLGSITGSGTIEAGDVILIDEKTVAVGLGYRTNQEGIHQFQSLIRKFVTEIMVVHLPHWNGPNDILHLMSIISPIDHDLAVVYSRLMPVSFREWLINRGFKLLEVPDSEYQSMACNILALAPRKCIMIAGNPKTRKLLEEEGVDVQEFSGEELCKKGGGGPTCLTRPLYRIH
jgi:N-dimethylarginine dimethylaminohydrolase